MNLTDPAVREAGARALREHNPNRVPQLGWDELTTNAQRGYLVWWDAVAAEIAPVLAQQADAGGWMGGGSVARDVIARLNEGPDVGGFDIDRQADAAGEA